MEKQTKTLKFWYLNPLIIVIVMNNLHAISLKINKIEINLYT